VLTVIYPIFNEGWGEGRVDLSAEAIRLGRSLIEPMPDETEAHALLALILINHARMAARFQRGELDDYRYYDSTRADLLRRLGRDDQAPDLFQLVTRVFPFLGGISLPSGDAGFVLEREAQAHAVARHLAVLDRDVEAVGLGNSQVPQSLRRGLDRVAGSRLPRFATDANQLGYAIDTLSHFILLLLIA
jgi:hypothetical protein